MRNGKASRITLDERKIAMLFTEFTATLVFIFLATCLCLCIVTSLHRRLRKAKKVIRWFESATGSIDCIAEHYIKRHGSPNPKIKAVRSALEQFRQAQAFCSDPSVGYAKLMDNHLHLCDAIRRLAIAIQES